MFLPPRPLAPRPTESARQMAEPSNRAIYPRALAPAEAARQMTDRFNQPIFPRPGYVFVNPTKGITPEGALLHHALLRSPEPGPKMLPAGASKLYSFVGCFALTPVVLGIVPYQEFTFELKPTSFQQIPPTQPPPQLGGEYSRLLINGSLLYRLRCVHDEPDSCSGPSAWLAKECSWPLQLSFAVNKKVCEPRRVPQYSKDLPVDISHFVVSGPNVLAVACLYAGVVGIKMAIAIEGIYTVAHETIFRSLEEHSSEQVLATIKRSINNDRTGDDDLVMLPSGRTISLLDPYSGCTFCETPVRGEECKHFECFDLETYLSQQERKHSGWPSIVDGWRCPICKCDARPHKIFKDGFYLQVRQGLMRIQQLDVQAITVEADGTWRPVLPPQIGSAERAKGGPRRDGQTNVKTKVTEVIELD